jgi:protein tyrosine/serine phosphatase
MKNMCVFLEILEYYIFIVMFNESKADAHLIIPGLWLGNIRSAGNGNFLKENNITTVFNCTKDAPFHNSIKKQYRVYVDDNSEEEELKNMELWSFEIVYKLTKEYKEGPVLVHCHAGMQRSATVIAMYLIAHGMKNDDAIKFIKSKRPIAFHHSVNFYKSIKGFEEMFNKEIAGKLTNA